jgi:hypothetical protein
MVSQDREEYANPGAYETHSRKYIFSRAEIVGHEI